MVQQRILDQSNDIALSHLEIELTSKLTEALNVEASMIRQKSRETWTTKGDTNNKFFHAALKVKQTRANIQAIQNENGFEVTTPEDIDTAFLDYYTNLLASHSVDQTARTFLLNLSLPQVTAEHLKNLQEPVTDEKIKKTVFSIRKEAYGGPDGFNATFFTHSWDIIKFDFLKAVHNFFDKSRMLASINSTNIALIPKVNNPTNVT